LAAGVIGRQVDGLGDCLYTNKNGFLSAEAWRGNAAGGGH
jgi:hypothetical protein